MRVHVRWTTTETIGWEADIDVPDGVDLDDHIDGNCPELIAVENEQYEKLGTFAPDEFVREVDYVGPARTHTKEN